MDPLVMMRSFGREHLYLDVFSPQDLSHRLFRHLYFLPTIPFTYFVSCNGLLCFYCSGGDGRVVLYNPTTRRLKFLPPAKQLPNSFEYKFRTCGLGYDPASKDYKVIRNFEIIEWDEEGHFKDSVNKFQLYSLATDSWNEIPGPDVYLGTLRAPVFLNGSCYWIALDCCNTRWVLAFDFSSQKFSRFDLPPIQLERDTKRYLLEINTSLCLILCADIGGKYKSFKIWQWTGERWMQLYNEFCLFDVETPLGCRDKFLFLEREIDSKSSQMLVCDLSTRELRKTVVAETSRVISTRELRETDVVDRPGLMRIVTLHKKSSYVMPNEISTSTYESEEGWNEYWRKCKEMENQSWKIMHNFV